MTFDHKKPVMTRGGQKARIVCTDAKRLDGDTILALVEKESGREYPEFYPNNGRFYEDKETKYDLVNIPERVERWANVYHPDTGVIFTRIKKEDEKLASIRAGLIKLVWEGDKLVEVTLEKSDERA